MAYSTQANLEAKFGTRAILRWSDVDESGTADTTIITTAITDADQIINEVLFPVHIVPFSATHPTINNTSIALAGYNLYIMRGLRDNSTDEMMTTIRQNALDLLDRIVDGQPILDSSGSEVVRKGINAPVAVDLSR